jgi:hypothetical protein
MPVPLQVAAPVVQAPPPMMAPPEMPVAPNVVYVPVPAPPAPAFPPSPFQTQGQKMPFSAANDPLQKIRELDELTHRRVPMVPAPPPPPGIYRDSYGRLHVDHNAPQR